MEYTGISSEAQAMRIAKSRLGLRNPVEITITDAAMEERGPLHEGMSVRLDVGGVPAGEYVLIGEPVKVEAGWRFPARPGTLDTDMVWNPEP